MKERIEEARRLAMEFHDGQVDKAGVEYIKHPDYVAEHVETDAEKIVAYLHDILEDTECPRATIKKMFGDEILEAVIAMTHIKGEDYFDYVRRAAQNPISRNVKKADLTHNMMIERIPNPTRKDYQRLEKYKKALQIIEESMKK